MQTVKIKVTGTTAVEEFDLFIEGTGWERKQLTTRSKYSDGVMLVNTDDHTDTMFIPFDQYLVRHGDDLLV